MKKITTTITQYVSEENYPFINVVARSLGASNEEELCTRISENAKADRLANCRLSLYAYLGEANKDIADAKNEQLEQSVIVETNIEENN